MHLINRPICILVISTLFIVTAFAQPAAAQPADVPSARKATIQAAILLDVSGSMDGLIQQAKAQLWTMVTTLGKVQCNNITPDISIALYDYGRPANGQSAGYVRQISAFTSDLDELSQRLFQLTTAGGDEYCGQVIYSALNELQWDTSTASYKVIFIAGNEDFLQGTLHYTKACNLANQKGVIVNTIYCGPKQQGIEEHWQLTGECGNGSFTHIDHNATIDDLPTPYDSLLLTMNDRLNGTYIGYGSQGELYGARQKSVDEVNLRMDKSALLKRGKVKSNAKLYNNAGWDLVDATAGKDLKTVLSAAQLPDSLKTKTPEELNTLITNKRQERTAIQQQMATLNAQRDSWLAAEKIKNTTASPQSGTLETEIESIIRVQVKRFNMQVVE